MAKHYPEITRRWQVSRVCSATGREQVRRDEGQREGKTGQYPRHYVMELGVYLKSNGKTLRLVVSWENTL